MKDSETLFKATLNRLKIRFEEKLTQSLTETALNAKDFPERLKEEWFILKEEILEEADRIEKENLAGNNSHQAIKKKNKSSSTQEEISEIKSILSDINKLIDSNS